MLWSGGGHKAQAQVTQVPLANERSTKREDKFIEQAGDLRSPSYYLYSTCG